MRKYLIGLIVVSLLSCFSSLQILLLSSGLPLLLPKKCSLFLYGFEAKNLMVFLSEV